MLGAIIGDIVGSRFEWHNYRKKDFNIFDKLCSFTDDTIMTCAVADIIASSDVTKSNIISTLKKYGKKYPHAGYGGSFYYWLMTDNNKPYNSFGNGAAMRISAVGWTANSETEVKIMSDVITGVTHNHPEGLKGALVTAMCIYYARTGKSLSYIEEYACAQYPEIKTMIYKDLVKNYRFNETCQNTVPQAIYCFLISNDFEDCLRNCISVGGDSDTLAAIGCSIAEAYYGISNKFKKELLKYFSNEDREILLKPVQECYKICGKTDYFKL